MIQFNNSMILPAIQFLALVAIYFNVSFFVSWEDLSFHRTISSSYFFDFVFWLGVALLLKEEPRFGKLKPKGAMLRGVLTGLLASIFCMGSIFSNLESPFKYLDQLAFKLLILAPFFEEIVFRGAFFELLLKIPKLSPKVKLMINALLFSGSHAAALLVLPKEYFSFIYYQLFYTLILGWVCAKSRERSGGLVEPIVIHLIFNFIFYLAITNYGL